MEIETKIAETRKTNDYYSRICSKRIESARVFPHLGEKGEGYSKFVQGVRLQPVMRRALKRG